MTQVRRSTFAIVALLCIVDASDIRAQKLSPQVAVQVPDPVLKAWGTTSRNLTGIEGTIVESQVVTLQGKEKKSSRQYHFGETSAGVFLVRKTDGRSSVKAVNPKYAFSVRQGVSGGAFELDQLFRGNLVKEAETEIRDTFEPFLFAGIEISGKKLSDLVRSPHFSLTSWTDDERQHRSTMRFNYMPPDKQNDTAIRGGRVTFFSNQKWMIESFQCATFWGSMQGKVEYRELNGTPIPKSYKVQLFGTKAASVTTTEYLLTDVSRLAAKTAPIYLGSYGIADPDNPNASKKTSPGGSSDK